jgi:serine/threonine-protein kinase
MGLVVKAWHLGLGEQVAIKMLRDDVVIAEETIARFVREAQAAVRLKSEHIARITDVGTFDDGKPYMVMEYLEGQDIAQLIAERGWLQPSLAIELVIQACDGLAEAHSLGIVHRDIKPTNLFLTSRPDGTVLLKVLDFGISKAPSGPELSITQTWSVLGSPAYMSPEQMRSARNVDARTDLWSLGAVLYETLEGHLPFQAASFSEMCVMVAVDPPTPTTETPRELIPIMSRCLAKSPDDRYPNVAELARDLARYAREPNQAQAIVDRIYRTLGRTHGRTRLRTPGVGVPQLAGPQLAGPQLAGPQLAGPQLAAPQLAGPQLAGPQLAGPQLAGPHLLEPTAPALPTRHGSHPSPTAGQRPRPPTPFSAHSAYRSPFGDLPNGFTPAPLAAGTPRSLDAGVTPSAPSFAAAISCSATSAVAGFAPALPLPRTPEATPASGLPSAGLSPSAQFAAHRPADMRTPPAPSPSYAPPDLRTTPPSPSYAPSDLRTTPPSPSYAPPDLRTTPAPSPGYAPPDLRTTPPSPSYAPSGLRVTPAPSPSYAPPDLCATPVPSPRYEPSDLTITPQLSPSYAPPDLRATSVPSPR